MIINFNFKLRWMLWNIENTHFSINICIPMDFNMFRPARGSLWMSILAAKLNMHYSVNPMENSESTLHTGAVENEKSFSSLILSTPSLLSFDHKC